MTPWNCWVMTCTHLMQGNMCSPGPENSKFSPLPMCQISQMQSLVDRISPSVPDPVPFWIDTTHTSSQHSVDILLSRLCTTFVHVQTKQLCSMIPYITHQQARQSRTRSRTPSGPKDYEHSVKVPSQSPWRSNPRILLWTCLISSRNIRQHRPS